MLKIEKASKRYKGQWVLKDINLQFDNKGCYGIVGINGSGKTLLLKALAGYLKLDQGHVYQDQREIRCGYHYITDAGIVIENPQFISHLTLRENLEWLKGLCQHSGQINLDYWIDWYQLKPFEQTAYRYLSLGTKKKLALIQAFMDQPKILVLDEPMSALDEESVAKTQSLIKQHCQTGLAIITSHYKEDIRAVCETVYHIKEGKVIAQGSEFSKPVRD